MDQPNVVSGQEETLDLLAMARQAGQYKEPTKEGSPDTVVSPVVPVLVGKDVDIRVEYRDPTTGKMLDAVVVSRIAASNRHRRARLEADLCAGRAFDSMAIDEKARIRMLAVVTSQLVEMPPWLAEYMSLDMDLLQPLYDECTLHEQLFFRPGAASSGAAQSEPPPVYVAVRSKLVGLQPSAPSSR